MRTRLSTLFATFVVGALIACKPAAPAAGGTGSAEDEQAIRAMADKYAAAYAAKDTMALGALVTQDYENVDPTGRHIQGRAAFQSAAAQELAMMPAGMSMSMKTTTDFVRWMDANHAVAGGTWETAPAMAGMPNKGSWMAVMTKEDGTWKMMSALGGADMTPAMPADTSKTKKP